jgi:hypothetical protein
MGDFQESQALVLDICDARKRELIRIWTVTLAGSRTLSPQRTEESCVLSSLHRIELKAKK